MELTVSLPSKALCGVAQTMQRTTSMPAVATGVPVDAPLFAASHLIVPPPRAVMW